MTLQALSIPLADRWHDFWAGDLGVWLLTRGIRVAMLLLAAALMIRFISWGAQKVTRRIDDSFRESDALVLSESSKHRQAVASVISWGLIALLSVTVFVQVMAVMDIPVTTMVGATAVVGAALGFGAQRIVQDLLAGFFIITERQYGLGDLVQLSVSGSSVDALGTVVDVTLRVTKLRNADGEMYTVPNGQIVKSLNLSKDWARAVVDIPVPATADLEVVRKLLQKVCDDAMKDSHLRPLLLDKPQVVGVESIELDTVNVRLVARTLPGRQFDVGRELRALVVMRLARAGIESNPEHRATVSVSGEGQPSTSDAGSETSGEQK
ncbi:mechanosensitive ion channel family protein [Mycolicibacterium brumae]|nr:mechanosensitive ion channel family protein [Mycolicibacterium brumae]RWA20294.1 hypothetical protein MBRU_15610 [Mycolicibacterium brumae DSM 44177]UWW09628.1 mechanosensitive ion channel family protein [Mycolicibacterium brumae]